MNIFKINRSIHEHIEIKVRMPKHMFLNYSFYVCRHAPIVDIRQSNYERKLIMHAWSSQSSEYSIHCVHKNIILCANHRGTKMLATQHWDGTLSGCSQDIHEKSKITV